MDPLMQELLAYVTGVTGILVLLMYAACWAFSLLALVRGGQYLQVPSDARWVLGDAVPGVSILKPLTGVDPLLETRLETHFTLPYPKFELLFCFYDDQDPAIAVVRKLQVKYPKVPVRLLCSSGKDIPNPLLQNLIQGFQAARYDYIWVCSSKLQVNGQMMEDMVVRLQPDDVALVHQLPFCVPPPPPCSTGHTLQQMYYSCVLGRFYMAFNMAGMCCVAGLSYIIKRWALEQQGLHSLSHHGHYMPHDFFLTKDLHTKGYKTVMSAFPTEENVSTTSVSSFVDRMVRWSRLRLNVLTLMAGVLEPLSQCLPLGLLTSFFLFLFFRIRPLHFLCGHVLAWIAVDIMLLRIIRIRPRTPEMNIFLFVYHWTLCQALCLWIYVKTLSSPHRIRWGPHQYHVRCGGRLVGSQFRV